MVPTRVVLRRVAAEGRRAQYEMFADEELVLVFDVELPAEGRPEFSQLYPEFRPDEFQYLGIAAGKLLRFADDGELPEEIVWDIPRPDHDPDLPPAVAAAAGLLRRHRRLEVAGRAPDDSSDSESRKRNERY